MKMSLERKLQILEDVRTCVDEARKSWKEAWNEGMDILEEDEIENPEIYWEAFDEIFENLEHALSDEAWIEDYEQEVLAEDEESDDDLGSSFANHIGGIFD